MKPGLKIVGLALIAALVIATLPISGWAEAGRGAATGEQPAGCHAHGRGSLPNQPMSPSTDYRCCLTGHHSIIVRAAFVARVSAEVLEIIVPGGPALVLAQLSGSHVPIVYFSSPPGLAPLRV